MDGARECDRELAGASTELAAIARELGLHSVAGDIESETERRLGSRRLRAVVLGEIKHGKSSLINALVGDAVLPVGVTPTTGAVVVVRADAEPGRWLLGTGGAARSLTGEQFAALARGQGTESGQLLAAVGEDRLPGGLDLIDTPGLNDLDRFRGAVSRGELPRADVLVLLLDATQVLSRSELAAIREAIAAVGGLEGSGATLRIVINRIDLVAERDRPALVEHVRAQLAELAPGTIEVFLTDARRALREPASDDPGVRGVGLLRERLRELAAGRADVLPARTRAALLRHGRLLGYNAAIQARALTLDHERLSAELAAVRGALRETDFDLSRLRSMIAAGHDRVRRDSQARISRFRGEIEASARQEIERADLRVLTDVLPGALQDAISEFTRSEADALRADLEALADEVLRTHGELARRRLFEATLRLGFRGPRLYVEPPSLAIEVSAILLGVVGTAVMYFGNFAAGLVMTIASPLTTMALRERSMREARRHARELVPPALAQACTVLDETVGGIAREHAGALEEHVTLASAALGEQLVSTLERARAQSADEAVQKRSAARLSELERELATVQARLEAIEVDVAPPAAG